MARSYLDNHARKVALEAAKGWENACHAAMTVAMTAWALATPGQGGWVVACALSLVLIAVVERLRRKGLPVPPSMNPALPLPSSFSLRRLVVRPLVAALVTGGLLAARDSSRGIDLTDERVLLAIVIASVAASLALPEATRLLASRRRWVLLVTELERHPEMLAAIESAQQDYPETAPWPFAGGQDPVGDAWGRTGPRAEGTGTGAGAEPRPGAEGERQGTAEAAPPLELEIEDEPW